ESPARSLDLGAGGGLPGLVLAAQFWPTTMWTFLDAQLRRTEFLAYAIEELGLDDRVEVVMERAEVVGRDPAHRAGYDLVVSRSFGAPAVTAECAAPLLRPGGVLVVSEPPATALETRWPPSEVAKLGLSPGVAVAVPGDVEAHLVRFVLDGAVADRYPRRTGIPSKRPLF
ncbi:MAG: RsmG family class I SAM-dependent methyltransferase, partial [Aquihabitans sp.]